MEEIIIEQLLFYPEPMPEMPEPFYNYIFSYFIGHFYTGFTYGLIGAGTIFAIVFTVSIVMKNVQSILIRS